jgi:hypothetical protein
MGVPFSKRRDKMAKNETEPDQAQDGVEYAETAGAMSRTADAASQTEYSSLRDSGRFETAPQPYDEHAPVHGVVDKSHEPTRWSPYASEPKLEERSAGHVVRCGDHVAYFDPADADIVDGLFALRSVPEKPSDKKTALIRLRTALALVKAAPVTVVHLLEKVTKMFHDALEVAPESESVAAADLEACLESWVLEPTRYAPFPDLAGAVAFMHLPVHDNRVVGMALRHRYVPDPEPLPVAAATVAVATNVTSANHQLRAEPNVKFARVSIWNEPARPTHDNFTEISSTRVHGFE